MKNTTLSRPAIRLLTYLCAAVCVSLIACPVADINRTAAENRCITVMRTGIDILTTAVSGIAEGEDITANIRAADTALILLELDADTAASVADFLRAASDTAPDSPEMPLVREYAEALYNRLCCIGDVLASSSSQSPSGAAASLMPTLKLSLPLESDTLPFSDTSDSDDDIHPNRDDADEISEARARDMASEILGLGITLRLNTNNRSKPEVYSFYCNNAFIDITKYGGYLLRYSLALTPDEPTLSTEEALRLCDSFVYSQGYRNIELCEWREQEGLLRAVYKIRGDGDDSAKIKAGIALDTGKICFYDAYEVIAGR